MSSSSNIKISKLIHVILFLIIIITMFTFFDNKPSDDKDKKSVNSNSYLMEKWYTPDGSTNKISIYKDSSDATFLTYENNNDALPLDYSLIASYECENLNCNFYGVYNKKNYVIIHDGYYLVYDYKNNKALKLDLPKEEYYKEIFFCGYKDNIYGLAISNFNGLFSYYSLNKKEFLTEFKYDYLLSGENILFKKDRFIAMMSDGNDETYYVIDSNDNNILLSSSKKISYFSNKEHVYYINEYVLNDKCSYEIYNSNFKLLLDGKRYSSFAVSGSGNLALKNDDESFGIYTKTGKLIKVSKRYYKILKVINDYVIVIDNDGYLKLVNYDGNVVAKYEKMQGSYVFKDELSGFDNGLNSVIYLIFEVNNDSKTDTLKYYYDTKTKEKGVKG